QCLHGSNLTGNNIYFWLIGESELVLCKCLSHAVFQQKSLVGMFIHGRVIKYTAVTALRFSLIHGNIRLFYQTVDIVPMFRKDAYPYAPHRKKLVIIYVEGLLNGIKNLPCNHHGIFGFLKGPENNRKLVPAKPGDCINFTYRSHKRFCNRLKQPVAHRMPQGIVDNLETVKVDEKQRYRTFSTVCIRNRLFEPVAEKYAIREPGQVIVVSQLVKPCLRTFLLGHIMPYPPDKSRHSIAKTAGKISFHKNLAAIFPPE